MLYFLIWCLLWPLVVALHYVLMVRFVGIEYDQTALVRMSKAVAGVYLAVGLVLAVFGAFSLFLR